MSAKLASLRSAERILIPKSSHNDWLSKEELAKLTVPEIVRRVTALQELMASKAQVSEQKREVDEEVWSALRKTGIFYLMVPRSRGGLEEGLQAFIDVILPIGEVDASLAWTTAFSVMHQWQLAQFSVRAQDQIWNELPYVTSAGSAFPPANAVKVEGGYRLSGRHKYCSGIMHSEWVNSFAALQTGTEKTLILCMLPIDEVKVIDTWYVSGMASTGSHDIEFEDVFVPDHFATKIDDMKEGKFDHVRPAYRIPFSTFLALVIATPILGAAIGETKRFRDRLIAPGPDGKVPDKPLARVGLARAKIDVKASELLVRDTARQAEEIAAEHLLTAADRIRIRAQCAYGASMCLHTLRTISDLSSSSAQLLSHPMQRALRDATMIASHATLEVNGSLEEFGRELLGLPSTWWLA